MRSRSRLSSTSGATRFLLGALLTGCAHAPPDSPPEVTRNLERKALEVAVGFKAPATQVIMALANEYLAGQRNDDGRRYFCTRAGQDPERALFGALCGLFEARMASDVPLLRRVAWVKGALSRLDQAAASDGLSRYLRGIVTARLPGRFARAQQAADDLEWMLAHAAAFPPGLRRGAYEGLASAYALLGRTDDAHGAAARAGGPRDAGAPLFLTDLTVNARDGLRFTSPALREVARGVFVARGYDFADIGFVVTDDCVVAIDAGTSEATAGAALAAFRKISDKPIRTIIVTHAHWDHVGGLRALAAPDTEIIAQAGFAEELRRVNAIGVPFRYFFGDGTPKHVDIHPGVLVAKTATMSIGGTRFALHPVHGGETDDALLVQLPDRGVVFVGDAFMPFFGAPFVAEGSPEGLFETIATLRALGPNLLVHGHAPLTENFPAAVLAPLDAALREVYSDTLVAIRAGTPLANALEHNLVPRTLERAPNAMLPFLIMRDNLVKRVYQQNTGYWKSDTEGMEVFSRRDQAAALDLVASGDERAPARAAATLAARGDFGMALRIAELGLATHPTSAALIATRARALDGLRAKYQFINPFKFVIYSGMEGTPLAPVP